MQGLGIPAGDAAAQAIGALLAVARAGLLGFGAATMLAMGWTHLPVGLVQVRRTAAAAA